MYAGRFQKSHAQYDPDDKELADTPIDRRRPQGISQALQRNASRMDSVLWEILVPEIQLSPLESVPVKAAQVGKQ